MYLLAPGEAHYCCNHSITDQEHTKRGFQDWLHKKKMLIHPQWKTVPETKYPGDSVRRAEMHVPSQNEREAIQW